MPAGSLYSPKTCPNCARVARMQLQPVHARRGEGVLVRPHGAAELLQPDGADERGPREAPPVDLEELLVDVEAGLIVLLDDALLAPLRPEAAGGGVRAAGRVLDAVARA